MELPAATILPPVLPRPHSAPTDDWFLAENLSSEEEATDEAFAQLELGLKREL